MEGINVHIALKTHSVKTKWTLFLLQTKQKLMSAVFPHRFHSQQMWSVNLKMCLCHAGLVQTKLIWKTNSHNNLNRLKKIFDIN